MSTTLLDIQLQRYNFLASKDLASVYLYPSYLRILGFHEACSAWLDFCLGYTTLISMLPHVLGVIVI